MAWSRQPPCHATVSYPRCGPDSACMGMKRGEKSFDLFIAWPFSWVLY